MAKTSTAEKYRIERKKLIDKAFAINGKASWFWSKGKYTEARKLMEKETELRQKIAILAFRRFRSLKDLPQLTISEMLEVYKKDPTLYQEHLR